jgi:GDP-4-dehydro-6-deoxy-D-mannose reductase
MEEKRVLITGITGFAGYHLSKKILELRPNFKIFGTKREESSIERLEEFGDKITLLDGDITDRKSLDDVIKKSQPHFIFHLAAIIPKIGIDDNSYWKVNVDGTHNLLESIVDHAKNVQMIHYASTGYVYGKSFESGLPLKETAKTLPIGTYEKTKLDGEKLFLEYFSEFDIPVVITRAFHHEGPKCREELIGVVIIKKIVEALNSGSRFLSLGNIKNVVDFTDVRDIVYGYLLAVEKGRSGEIYNLCSGNGHSVEELIQFALNYTGLGKNVEINVDKNQIRRGEFPVRIGDYSKAEKELGWEPKMDFLEQTYIEMINAFISKYRK